jgi:hypothetical protein
MLGKCCTTELHPLSFRDRIQLLAKAGLEYVILLPQSPKCWDCSYLSPCLIPGPLVIIHYHASAQVNRCPSPVDVSRNLDSSEQLKRQRGKKSELCSILCLVQLTVLNYALC